MDELLLGFGHEAQYPDPAFGLENWKSWPTLAHNLDRTFSNFSPAAQPDDYQTLPYIESRHADAETHQENQQYPFETHSEWQPVPKRKSLGGINEETYTAVCGVYSPEKMPPTGKGSQLGSPYHCPRCDRRLSKRIYVKSHFPDCIAKHGNPDALRWNDHVSLKPTHHGGPRDHVRKKNFDDTLEAYSGITIPSKLSPGDKVITYKSKSKKGDFLCAICGGGPFGYTAHVKSHFLTCVKRYGNPKGANWYDRLGPNCRVREARKGPNAVANVPPTM